METQMNLRFGDLSVDKCPEKYDDYECPMKEIYRPRMEQLGETEMLKQQSIQQVREWIAKHPDIKRCRTDAPFLLRFLRTNKFSFLRTIESLERFLLARTMHPDWFQNLSLDSDQELLKTMENGYLIPIPKLDSQGRIVFFSSSAALEPNRKSIMAAIKMNHLMGEVFGDSPEAQFAGLVLIYDMSRVDMSLLGTMTLYEIRQLVELTNSANAVRVQELHFINTPAVSRTIANMVLQLLSEKIRSRIFCHGSLEELYANVDRALLPEEFGGTVSVQKAIEDFKAICHKMKPRLLALDQMEIDVERVTERRNKTDPKGEDLGIGCFRKLQVD
ncbi:clavesin-1-like [Uranotaenia lowii]|uniref:clavesin-1-like n=1 Tax=Uranotaenia lowii TaxID=190385 RepID=UPI0024787B10|nr:clavesin-1-like [Uranotaenia lowii]